MPTVYCCYLCKAIPRHDFGDRLLLAKHHYESHDAAFCCNYCNSQFSTEADRDRHVEKYHVSGARFLCVICGNSMSTKKSLSSHQKDYHPDVADLTCKRCNVIFSDAECRNLHQNYCPADQPQNNANVRIASPNNGQGRQHQLPELKDGNVARVVFTCEYCSSQFTNRDDHGCHLISVHHAGVTCGYCERQFSAPRKDENAALLVFRAHLERDHKKAGSWTCIYCNLVFNARSDLVGHHFAADHRLYKCHVCASLLPSRLLREVHAVFQHTNRPLPAGLCLCCLMRIPINGLYDHILRHVESSSDSISCNECFVFINNPDELRQHMRCFESEAMRFEQYMNNRGSTSHSGQAGDPLCNFKGCSFSSASIDQLKRHNGWLHKSMQCVSCGAWVMGYAGMRKHVCTDAGTGNSMAAVGHGSNSASRANRSSIESIHKNLRENLDLVRARSASFSEGGSSLQQQRPAPTATNFNQQASTLAAVGSGSATIELPDSPADVKVEPCEHETATIQNSSDGVSLAKDNEVAAAVSSPGKSVMQNVLGVDPSSAISVKTRSNTSSPAIVHNKAQRGTPIPSDQENVHRNRPREKPMDAGILDSKKRPALGRSKPAESSSSSSSSSSSDEIEAVLAAVKHRRMIIAAKPLLRRDNPMTSDSSSTSSDEEEPPARKRPNIATVGNERSNDTATKSKSIGFPVPRGATCKSSTTALGRQSVILASAEISVSSSSDEEPLAKKRKSKDGRAKTQEVFVCTLCDTSSPYRNNIVRHIASLHRIGVSKCQEFLEKRVVEKPVSSVEDESTDESDQPHLAHSVAVAVEMPCATCKQWKKKIRLLEKFVMEVGSRMERTKRTLEAQERGN